MDVSGKNLVHALNYLVRFDSARTQTSENERARIRHFAAHKKRAVEIGPEGHLGHLQKRLDRYSNRLPYHGDEADSDPPQ